MRFAKGVNALAICDRCGLEARYSELVPDGYTKGWRVHPGCRDIAHPAEKPFRVDEGIVLKNPRPNRDNDATVIASGTAQAGGVNTITLAADSTSLVVKIIGQAIELTGGTGSGQERTITGYDGDTKVATVDEDWTTPPDGTSTYEIAPALLVDALQLQHTFGGGT